MQPLLRDEKLQAELEETGFVVLDAISDEVVEQLRVAYANTRPAVESDSFFTTTLSNDVEYRKRVNSSMLEILTDALDNVFVNHLPVYGNFMVKPSGDNKTTCQLHQDWTYVDEERFLAVNIWIPLTDLTEQNGTLHLVPGSHKLDKRVRGRDIYWPYFDAQEYLIKTSAKPVYLKKGQPVIFIGKTFHYSPPNVSQFERVGASVVVVHKEAQLYNYYQRDNNIYRAKVDCNYFVEHGIYSLDFYKELEPEFFADAEDYKREANISVIQSANTQLSF